jgi:hypothetical protein
MLAPDPFSDHGSHHRDVGQPHRGCGPGTAHCFLSMAHGHGCSQAGWPCSPFDIRQALAPGSCSYQPEEGEGDSYTEVLGGAEGQETHSGRPHDSLFPFLLCCTRILGSQDSCLFPFYLTPRTSGGPDGPEDCLLTPKVCCHSGCPTPALRTKVRQQDVELSTSWSQPKTQGT